MSFCFLLFNENLLILICVRYVLLLHNLFFDQPFELLTVKSYHVIYVEWGLLYDYIIIDLYIYFSTKKLYPAYYFNIALIRKK